MIKKLLFSILFIFSLIPLYSEASTSLHLSECLREAKAGDYIVTTQNKNYILLHIFESKTNQLTLEEITVPIHRYNSSSWQEWIDHGAPSNSSWVIYEIELSTGKVLEFYSFTQKAWIDIPPSDNILATLITLPLKKIAAHDRKRIGPTPLPGALDFRTLWQPQLTFEGHTLKDTAFEAWRTMWPRNGSELAGKTVDLYLPQVKGHYLSYFPYWIEVIGGGNNAKIRVKDSGYKLKTPTRGLPRRPVKFLSQGRWSEEKLEFSIKSPEYFNEFQFFAKSSKSWEKLIPLSHTVREGSDKSLILSIEKEYLRKELTNSLAYSFIIMPLNHPHLSDETSSSQVFSP